MKQLFVIAALMLLPLTAAAQDNTWEQPEKTATATNPDAKYLAGAVPEVDGRVIFSTTIKAPGKSAKQIFDLLRNDMERITKESNQFEQSRITLADSVKMQVVGNYQEWLVFKNKPLNLDRTRFFYNLIADCRDGEATIQLTRIHYLYDEERLALTYKAEEWINDRYGLNKKQTKLARVSGKFRRKTIDRKDYLFNRFAKLLEK
jgi:colicin import membrane protein